MERRPNNQAFPTADVSSPTTFSFDPRPSDSYFPCHLSNHAMAGSPQQSDSKRRHARGPPKILQIASSAVM